MDMDIDTKRKYLFQIQQSDSKNANTARLTPQKFSWLLRHSPAVAEHMDLDGFVQFEILERISGASRDRMQQIITTEDRKGRYEVRGTEVRAVNGHSVHFCQNYEILESPPTFLYHATNNRAAALIMSDALKRMGRHYIHLYDTPPAKTSVRYRILRIRPPEGHIFYRTKNGYILSREDIPAKFIEVWN
ncbi:probable RNA 2'-phosphotransferase [Sabethes cyaneus]|uniref:probable RNA 2'-phosphotransferase n=1 Tax=Sabethes cyaneus TaxID=53552 RepID=UPI00237DBA99|nr:probable RNA 2'-phosphotransferase [Sabethes cyaneus]